MEKSHQSNQKVPILDFQKTQICLSVLHKRIWLKII
jgi:hypothetical protein